MASLIQVTLPLMVLINITVANVITGPTDTTCTLDNPQTYSNLEQCLEIGENFIRKYLKYVQREKSHNKCRQFEEFEVCLDGIFASCPSLRSKLHDQWIRVYDVMKCSCTGAPECLEQVRCFDNEYTSIMMSRCDDHYRFNRRQRTRHNCHHLRENIRCKESLVTSACGNVTGEFAFHMFKLYDGQTLQDFNCVVTQEQEYTGFRYSERCPANFTAMMQECAGEMSTDDRLGFFEENDLIALKKKDVRDACRKYKGYQRCLRPLRERCPEGSQIVYDYLGQLRTYLLKMEFICSVEKDSYIEHLPCYKRVLNNGTLSACGNVWRGLQPLLNRVSAHQFYCQVSHPQTQDVRSSLAQLVSCYEEVFRNECGEGGGRTIGALMSEAFMDPFYLQYSYKPDCDYHRVPPTEIPPDRPPQATAHERWHSTTTRRPTTQKTVTKPNRPPPKGSSQTESKAIHSERSTGGAVTLAAGSIILTVALGLLGVIR